MPPVLTPRVPVNQILHDQWIRHAVMLERLKTSEIRAMIKLLDKQVAPAIIAKADKIATRWGAMGYSKLSIARRRRALLKQLRDMDRLIAGGTQVMHARLKGGLTALAKSEAAWAASMLQRQIPLKLNYSLPAPHLLQSIVTTRPMHGKHLREWTKAAGANTAKQVRQAIMIGVAQGEGVGPIVRRIRGTAANGFKDGVMQTARHEAAMVTRTAISHVSSHAREALFAEHKEVIEKVRWMSTLDTRTSQICASLDGQAWDIGKGPRPPAHPNCRSTMVPVAKPPVGIPGIDASKLPPATRAAMGGPVPASTGFGPWLKGQSVASQNAMLGVGKAKLFRRGKVPIEKFTDLKTLRPLTLTQLQRLEAKLTGTKLAPKVKVRLAKPKRAKPKTKQAKAKSTKPTTKTPPQKTKPATGPVMPPFVPAKTKAEARKRLREFVTTKTGPGKVGTLGDLPRLNAILEGLEMTLGRKGIRLGSLVPTKAKNINGSYWRKREFVGTRAENKAVMRVDKMRLKIHRQPQTYDPRKDVVLNIKTLKQYGQWGRADMLKDCPGWSQSVMAEFAAPGTHAGLRATTIHESAHAIYYHADDVITGNFGARRGLIAEWEALMERLPRVEHYKVSEYAAANIRELFAEAVTATKLGRYVHPDIAALLKKFDI